MDDIIVGILVIAFLGGYFYIKLKKGYTNPFKISFVKTDSSHKESLEKYFPYYNLLSEKEKKKFLRRVNYFVSIKTFEAKDFEKVTEEMKALISASVIQLTFGLPEVYLSHFEKIAIYSDETAKLSKEEQIKNQEEGVVVLSWKKFLFGYIQPSGSYNYGLHEMAKALQVENKIMNDEYGFLNEPDLESWKQISKRLLKKMEAGEDTFFQDFEGKGRKDLFPVVIESFFERPVEFNEVYPDLYVLISDLLNQNPLKLFEAKVIRAQ